LLTLDNWPDANKWVMANSAVGVIYTVLVISLGSFT
jgi:hypothetical protein